MIMTIFRPRAREEFLGQWEAIEESSIFRQDHYRMYSLLRSQCFKRDVGAHVLLGGVGFLDGEVRVPREARVPSPQDASRQKIQRGIHDIVRLALFEASTKLIIFVLTSDN